MSDIEYTTIDKSVWGDGPWMNEPDKTQWTDKTTGYPCLSVRHPRMGFWCGYVGVPPGHSFHGIEWDDVHLINGERPPAHGGLTYANDCDHGDETTNICHVPAPGEPDNVWWFGFDCAHCYDLVPWIAHTAKFGPRDDVYRDLDYVRSVCRDLAVWLQENA